MSEPIDDAPAPPDGDDTLDGIEADLDTVEAALAALDADDLDGAEALAAGLDAPEVDDDPASAPSGDLAT